MASLVYFSGIRYGSFKDLEVAVDPSDNSLWVTQPTIAKLLDFGAPNRASEKLKSKSLKVFAGKGYVPPKKIKAKDSLGRPNELNAVPFDSFLLILYWQLAEGNDLARKLVIAGFADSFSSMVLDQCGIKLTQEQRQEVISFYLCEYHGMMDWVRDTYLAIHGKTPDADYYRQINTEINLALFGVRHFKCDRLTNAGNKALRRLENYQMLFMESRFAKQQDDPLKLIKQYFASTKGEG